MKWIVVDGIDGSGKSTVAETIATYEKARGRRVMTITHPSNTVFGEMTRSSLSGEGKLMRTIASIFFIMDVLDSLRRRRTWNEFDLIIFVRYIMATAYLPESLYLHGYKFFTKLLPAPDSMILVDVVPEVAMRRIEVRQVEKEMFENIRSLEKVRNKILILAKQDWIVLDNSGTKEMMTSSLHSILEDLDS